MIPVILESPYAGLVQRNKAYLQLCIIDSLGRGESPFASHQMYTDALDDLNPVERKQGIEAAFIWGTFAKRTVVYTDYGLSEGVLKFGIPAAELAGRPVEHRTLSGFDVAGFYTSQDEAFDTPWEELLARHASRVQKR